MADNPYSDSAAAAMVAAVERDPAELEAEIAAATAAKPGAETGTETEPEADAGPGAETASEPAAPAVASGPRTINLDELLPDVADLPPTLRNAPVRTLLQDRIDAIRKRDEIGTLKNAAEARNAVLEKALEVLANARPTVVPAPVPAPAPVTKPETALEAMRRRGAEPDAFVVDPSGVLAGAFDTMDERSQTQIQAEAKQIREEVAAARTNLDQRLAAIEQREYVANVKSAYRIALPDRNPVTDPDLDDIANYIQTRGLPPDNPASYVEAAQWIAGIAARHMPVAAPTAAAAPAAVPATPTAAVPAATFPLVPAPAPAASPAPPAGSGAPAALSPATTSASVAALSRHERDAISELITMFPTLKAEHIDTIANSVAADRAAGRGTGPRRRA